MTSLRNASRMRCTILIVCLCSMTGASYASLSGGITQPTNSSPFLERHRSLWSMQIVNAFDSARVSYELSEITLISGQQGSTPIWLRLRPEDLNVHDAGGSLYAGADASGPDYQLAELAVTRAFAVPSQGASVAFTRVLSAESCDLQPPSGPRTGTNGSEGAPSRDDHRFLAGHARILDTTSFALQVVDANSGTILATIDSVGVLPNDQHDYATRIGTFPDATQRTVVLPSACHGRYVRLRVLPYRMGPTPHGMHLRRIPRMIHLSEAYSQAGDRSDWEPSWWNFAYQRQLDSLQSTVFIEHAYNEVAATGCTPWLPPGLHLYGHHQNLFVQLYKSASTSNAACAELRELQRLWYASTTDRDDTHKHHGLSNVADSIDIVLSNNELTIHNRGNERTNVRLHAIDMRGTRHELAAISTLHADATVSVSYLHLLTGLYVVNMSTNDSTLAVLPISVSR